MNTKKSAVHRERERGERDMEVKKLDDDDESARFYILFVKNQRFLKKTKKLHQYIHCFLNVYVIHNPIRDHLVSKTQHIYRGHDRKPHRAMSSFHLKVAFQTAEFLVYFF